MRKILLFFIASGFALSTLSVHGQENHGLMSVSGTAAMPNENSRQLLYTRFEVSQNSPNPFSDFTQIEYASPVQGFVEMKVVNLLGKEVFHRIIETESGRNIIRFEGEDFLPGVYIYSLSNGAQTITRRMVISKK